MCGETMEETILIHNITDMKRLASIFTRYLRPGFVLGLGGDLGSGKTTFTKFLAEAMGIKVTVSSPTFTLLKIYDHPLPLYHMDVYRLEDIGFDYGLDDYIYGKGVAVIEWYQYIPKMLPEQMMTMNITRLSETEREITLKGSGEYAEYLKDLVDRYRH